MATWTPATDPTANDWTARSPGEQHGYLVLDTGGRIVDTNNTRILIFTQSVGTADPSAATWLADTALTSGTWTPESS